jgi:hypothetical protein
MRIRNARPIVNREAVDECIQLFNTPVDDERYKLRKAGGYGCWRGRAEIEMRRKQQAIIRAD